MEGTPPEHVQRELNQVHDAAVPSEELEIESYCHAENETQQRRPAGQRQRAGDGIEDAAFLAQVVPPFGHLDQHLQAESWQPLYHHCHQNQEQNADDEDHRGYHQSQHNSLFEVFSYQYALLTARSSITRAVTVKTSTTSSRINAAVSNAESYIGMDIISP